MKILQFMQYLVYAFIALAVINLLVGGFGRFLVFLLIAGMIRGIMYLMSSNPSIGDE